MMEDLASREITEEEEMDEFEETLNVFRDESLSDKDDSLSGDNLKLWVLPKPAPKRKRKYRKTELAKRRKLIREDLIHYHPTHLPRIIKSDVRRQYAFMYSNVFNQCDYDYMIQFVQTFIKPRSTVSVQRTGEFDERFLSTECKSSCDFWFARMQDAADITLTLKETQFFLRSDTTSRLASKVQLSGTKLLSIPKRLLPSSITSTSLALADSQAPAQSVTDILRSFHGAMSFRNPCKNIFAEEGENSIVQVKYCFDGELALDIDGECLITMIDMKSNWNYSLGQHLQILLAD